LRFQENRVFIGIFFDRTWRDRRLVWTKEELFFARHGALAIIDNIPLHEIDDVLEMNEETEQKTRSQSTIASTTTQFKPNKDSPMAYIPPDIWPGQEVLTGGEHNSSAYNMTGISTRISHLQAHSSSILQIKTAVFGFNAGKTYYVSTRRNDNPEECRKSIASQLIENVRAARRNAEAKSRFQRSQEKVQYVQQSLVFQLIMAFFIMLVRPTTRLMLN
jgi:hypothetical protein